MTIFENLNFRNSDFSGRSVCVTASAGRPTFYESAAAAGIYKVGSIRKGCFGKTMAKGGFTPDGPGTGVLKPSEN